MKSKFHKPGFQSQKRFINSRDFKNAGIYEMFVKSLTEGMGQLAKNQLENNNNNNTSRSEYERKVY